MPRNGFLICSTKVVETTRSSVLATSSNFLIRAFVSKCGASVVASVFPARDASAFPGAVLVAAVALHSRELSAFELISRIRLSRCLFHQGPGVHAVCCRLRQRYAKALNVKSVGRRLMILKVAMKLSKSVGIDWLFCQCKSSPLWFVSLLLETLNWACSAWSFHLTFAIG